MRRILRTLPIRWQITLLHATILAVVLAAGGLALWNAQRTFQYDGMVAKQLTELRALVQAAPDLKEIGPEPLQKTDPQMLKEHYAKIAAAILMSSDDPAAARKQLALLNPKLADQIFPPGSALPPRDEMKAAVSRLVFEGFPPDEDLKDTGKRLESLDPNLMTDRFPAPPPEQPAFQKYLAALVEKAGAKDRGVVMVALDGHVLAQSSIGPACEPSLLASKAALAGDAGEKLLRRLKAEQYVEQIEQGRLTLLIPVTWQNGQPLALAQMCVSTDATDASLNQLAASLAVGWALVVGVATALGVTATRRVLRPLDQVVAATGRIAAGDLGQRVGMPPGRTEIAQLGAAFDAMVARLEQAFAAQRRFVADAAHELRTPLTALTASVELLLMGAADSDRATAQRLLRYLDSELSRVIRLTNDLLTLSRLDAGPRVALCPTDLTTLLGEVVEQSWTLPHKQELSVDVESGLWVEGDADRLRQIVLNLLDNARNYTPPGGQIALRATSRCSALSVEAASPPAAHHAGLSRAEASAASAQSWVVIEVQDTGVGIPADALPHLFDRFYRVDSARARASGGSGLGLAIVKAIVQAHHGQVAIRSTPGEGTCVTLQLPRLASPPTQPADLQEQV